MDSLGNIPNMMLVGMLKWPTEYSTANPWAQSGLLEGGHRTQEETAMHGYMERAAMMPKYTYMVLCSVVIWGYGKWCRPKAQLVEVRQKSLPDLPSTQKFGLSWKLGHTWAMTWGLGLLSCSLRAVRFAQGLRYGPYMGVSINCAVLKVYGGS